MKQSLSFLGEGGVSCELSFRKVRYEVEELALSLELSRRKRI